MKQLLRTAVRFQHIIKQSQDLNKIKSILKIVLDRFKYFKSQETKGIQKINLSTLSINDNHIYFQIDVDQDQYQNLINDTKIKSSLVNQFQYFIQEELKQPFNVSFTFFPN